MTQPTKQQIKAALKWFKSAHKGCNCYSCLENLAKIKTVNTILNSALMLNEIINVNETLKLSLSKSLKTLDNVSNLVCYAAEEGTGKDEVAFALHTIGFDVRETIKNINNVLCCSTSTEQRGKE